mmetsp:Transcript_1900/g.2906  ORF Transcript_1900/g.2906 Transcript_1900/m.2906 type:complete len:299 (-) Transcript_1900:61-957(-)
MGESALKSYISGTFAGLCGVCVGHPLDLIKVRLQVQSIYGGSTSALSSFKNAFSKEGVRGLYRGVTPPMVAEATINSFLFGTYVGVLNVIAADNIAKDQKPNLSHIYFAGCAAGMPAALCVSPLELIKARIQVQGLTSPGGVKTSPLQCAKQAIKMYGFSSLFTGLTSTLMRDIPSYGFYFLTYEAIQRKFLSEENVGLGKKIGVEIVGGGVAGMVAWGSTYPFDVMKTRLQTQHLTLEGQGGGKPKYAGLRDCFIKSYREEGITVFTKGLGPTLVRAFPTNAAIFAGYEFIKRILPE